MSLNALTNKDTRTRSTASDWSEPCLVSLERGKTNSHLGDNAGDDGTEACLQHITASEAVDR